MAPDESLKGIIANWIRDARTSARLTGTELGLALEQWLGKQRGNSKGNISHWEQGRYPPSAEQLAAISKITNTPLPEVILKAFPATAQKLMEKSLGEDALRVAQAFEKLADREQRAAVITMLKAFGTWKELSAGPRLVYGAPPRDVSDSLKKKREPDATDTYALQDPRDNDEDKDDAAGNQI